MINLRKYFRAACINVCISCINVCVLCSLWVSLVAQMVKNLPAMQETWIQSLNLEDPLEKGMVIHSSIIAWRISWTEKPSGLKPMGSQIVRHNWVTNASLFHAHSSTYSNPASTQGALRTSLTKVTDDVHCFSTSGCFQFLTVLHSSPPVHVVKPSLYFWSPPFPRLPQHALQCSCFYFHNLVSPSHNSLHTHCLFKQYILQSPEVLSRSYTIFSLLLQVISSTDLASVPTTAQMTSVSAIWSLMLQLLWIHPPPVLYLLKIKLMTSPLKPGLWSHPISPVSPLGNLRSFSWHCIISLCLNPFIHQPSLFAVDVTNWWSCHPPSSVWRAPDMEHQMWRALSLQGACKQSWPDFVNTLL